MEKVFIKNRDGKKLAVVIEQNPDQRALAFVMHGQGGFKEQPHVRAMCEAFYEQGSSVVSFDTANSIGESGGRIEDTSITSFLADLEDVVAWAKLQPWYVEPFFLAGHSDGGMTVAVYAEQHPENVKGVAPISASISGKLLRKTFTQEELDEWRSSGWRIAASISKPGVLKRIPWSDMEDHLKYDLIVGAGALSMPVLLIVGEKDSGTPPKNQRLLYEKLPGDKELNIIAGSPHTFREPEHLAEVKKLVSQWAAKVISSNVP